MHPTDSAASVECVVDKDIEYVARFIARHANRSPKTRQEKIQIVRRVLEQWREATVVSSLGVIEVRTRVPREKLLRLVEIEIEEVEGFNEYSGAYWICTKFPFVGRRRG